MYRRLGKFELALADFSESLRHDRNSALAFTGRGNAYPAYATAFYNRGNSRLETGDKDGAIADYRQAAKLNPALKQATERLQQMETQL